MCCGLISVSFWFEWMKFDKDEYSIVEKVPLKLEIKRIEESFCLKRGNLLIAGQCRPRHRRADGFNGSNLMLGS